LEEKEQIISNQNGLPMKELQENKTGQNTEWNGKSNDGDGKRNYGWGADTTINIVWSH
jgi:hypothetical protein